MDLNDLSSQVLGVLSDIFRRSGSVDTDKFQVPRDTWRKVPEEVVDEWPVGEIQNDDTDDGEVRSWAWWVPCSLTGQWRSRTHADDKQVSQSAKEILSLVVVLHEGNVFRTYVGVVYDSELYDLNYPKRKERGRSHTKTDQFRELMNRYTKRFVFVQPALSCHALCIDTEYKRNGSAITVSIYHAPRFNMEMPPGSVLHSHSKTNKKEGIFALSRYACVNVQQKGAKFKFVFAIDPAGKSAAHFCAESILKAGKKTLEVLKSRYDVTASNVQEHAAPKTKPRTHVLALYKHNQTYRKAPIIHRFELNIPFPSQLTLSDTSALGNLCLHYLRKQLQLDDINGVVAPEDEEATLEVYTTVATMPGIKDLSKGLPDQTYTQRTLTRANVSKKTPETETIKRQTMDLYGHTRVDLERFEVLGDVLLARDIESRAGFQSLHPELVTDKEILGIQRILPTISHTTQAITVAPMNYQTNAFAKKYARGLEFRDQTSVLNALYPLSVYTPNFETVHSLLPSEMAKIVSRRMARLRMNTDEDSAFAHPWMYNAVKGEVWSPFGLWSSGTFHPRIVSALGSRRENLIELFYYARMMLPSGALHITDSDDSVYDHIAYIRELAREALHLYSTCGTLVQPMINQFCLGRLYQRRETSISEYDIDDQLRGLLLTSFSLDEPNKMLVGNMNLALIAKTYAHTIQG